VILPDKYVDTQHSLLGQASVLIEARGQEMTVSELWTRVQGRLSYERFILGLDLLFMLGVVELRGGLLRWSE